MRDYIKQPSGDNTHRGPCSPNKLCIHSLYNCIIIIPPHKYHTIYRPKLTLRKKELKKKNNKWGHPLSWLVIGDGNSTSVYNSCNTQLVPWTEIESPTAITTQPEESKEKKVAIENNRGKVTRNHNILKKSKDRNSHFLVMFSSSKA